MVFAAKVSPFALKPIFRRVTTLQQLAVESVRHFAADPMCTEKKVESERPEIATARH